jgi:hypothetical protein
MASTQDHDFRARENQISTAGQREAGSRNYTGASLVIAGKKMDCP